MSKKAVVPLLTAATMVMMALPVVGALRGGRAAATEPTPLPVCTGYVALTFDDGPTPTTRDLLELLDQRGVRATMFDIGSQAEAYPELVKAQLDGGHAVENHSQTHPDLRTITTAEVTDEVSRAQAALRDAGANPSWFRAPYGYTDERVAAAVRAGGLQEVLWTTDTFDWKESSVSEVVDRALQVQPGGIILMHDGYKRTLQALPAILDGLAARGLCTGKIVPDTADRWPDGWADNTFRAKAGAWDA
jgi:peptidoglycan/xylan/chitin deacetylase (PgdA/CDA1 family)